MTKTNNSEINEKTENRKYLSYDRANIYEVFVGSESIEMFMENPPDVILAVDSYIIESDFFDGLDVETFSYVREQLIKYLERQKYRNIPKIDELRQVVITIEEDSKKCQEPIEISDRSCLTCEYRAENPSFPTCEICYWNYGNVGLSGLFDNWRAESTTL